jgi:restriction system protein
MRHFWRIFLGNCATRSRSVRLCYKNARSVTSGQTAEFLSKRIVFIDGEQLAKLMIRYNVGCRVEYSLDIKKLDEEFFE